MGVDIPVDAISSIIREQKLWEKHRLKKSSKEHIYRRYRILAKLIGFIIPQNSR